MYIRFRFRSSASLGTWQYDDVSKPDYDACMLEERRLEEWRLELKRELEYKHDIDTDYTEHYRGCEIEIIKEPPLDWLINMTTSLEAQSSRISERIKKYKNKISSIQNLEDAENILYERVKK